MHVLVPRGRTRILKLSGFACNVLRAKQKKVAACASVLNYVSVNVQNVALLQFSSVQR